MIALVPSAPPAEVAASPVRLCEQSFYVWSSSTLSKLNRTLSFCEAEIKNEFCERFNPFLGTSFQVHRSFSKTTVFEGLFA
jgi:hypothetical protein